MEWPRIPVAWLARRRYAKEAAGELAASAAPWAGTGCVAGLRTLPVPGVTAGERCARTLAAIAVPSTTGDGRNMTGDDFALTAGWGHFGQPERRSCLARAVL